MRLKGRTALYKKVMKRRAAESNPFLCAIALSLKEVCCRAKQVTKKYQPDCKKRSMATLKASGAVTLTAWAPKSTSCNWLFGKPSARRIDRV